MGAVMDTELCGHHADSWGPGAHVQGPPHTGTCLHTDTCLPSHTQLSRSHTCALMHTYTHTCACTHARLLPYTQLSHSHTCALMHTYPYSHSRLLIHTCSHWFPYSSCPPCSLHSHTHMGEHSCGDTSASGVRWQLGAAPLLEKAPSVF